MSRCVLLELAGADDPQLRAAMANRSRQIAITEGLDGRPAEDYVKLVAECGANFRAVLQEIESGRMLEPGAWRWRGGEPVDLVEGADGGGPERGASEPVTEAEAFELLDVSTCKAMGVKQLKHLAAKSGLAPRRDVWHARKDELVLMLTEGKPVPAYDGPRRRVA